MANFYPNQWHATCGNNCNAKIQTLLYTEAGEPSGEVDWEEAQRVYGNHVSNCSVENPFTTDNNCFYGDPNDCYSQPNGYCEY